MPQITCCCAALKISWLKKILDINYKAAWKMLLVDPLENFCGDKILYFTREGLIKASQQFNPFWKNVFEIWSKLERPHPTTPEEIMFQPIRLNNKTKREGRTVIFSHWIRSGIFFIKDLLTEDGNFFSFVDFRNSGICINLMLILWNITA